MSDPIRLKVLTPTGLALDLAVSAVTVPGLEGEFGVLPAHTPYLSLVRGGAVGYNSEGTAGKLAVKGGLAEVKENAVTILAESVFLPGDIDTADLDRMEKETKARLEEARDRGEGIDELNDELSFIGILRAVSASR